MEARALPSPSPSPLYRRSLGPWGFLQHRAPVVRLLVDLGMLGLAVLAARVAEPELESRVLILFLGLVLVLLHARGLYRRRLRVAVSCELSQLLGAVSLASMTLLAGAALAGEDVAFSAPIALVWGFSAVSLGAGRSAMAFIERRARESGRISRPTLVVGAGVVGARIARRLMEERDLGLRPIGFIDDGQHPRLPDAAHLPVLGGPAELSDVVARTGAEHVILAFSSLPDYGLIPLVRRCHELGLTVSLVPRLFESFNDRMAVDYLGGVPLLGLQKRDPRGLQFAVKHGFDRVAAALALVVLAPVMLAVALAVKVSSSGPVLFRQRRVGRDGHVFEMLKFRTMSGSPDSDGEADSDWAAGVLSGHGPPALEPGEREDGYQPDDRSTALGRLLRRYSLDELPQLLNVLAGDMSLVGPRPERASYVLRFEATVYRYGDRHRVKSGLTGWAQVHGLRGRTSLTDRVEWDNFYIQNWSLWLDLKILLLTLRAIVRATDAA